MHCTESSIWTASLSIGMVVMAMQITPIFLMSWLHVSEPRGINATDDKGEQVEAPFSYQAGYFEMCRWLPIDLNWDELGVLAETTHHLYMENPPLCVWNSVYTGEDLFDFSFATSAILSRLAVPMGLHVAGAVLSLVALVLSLLGHMKKDAKAIYSAICYILAGLVISIAVLQVICVVDDEMVPRMKPNAAGEVSKYSFTYGKGAVQLVTCMQNINSGVSFMSTALSFIPIQVCIYLQTTIYFNRYASPTDKSRIVPGLSTLCNIASCSTVFIPTSASSSVAQIPAFRPRSPKFGSHPLVSTGSSLVMSPGHISGVRVNFAGRLSRRESRVSKDFGVFGVQQEVSSINPLLTASFVRRPSIQLSL